MLNILANFESRVSNIDKRMHVLQNDLAIWSASNALYRRLHASPDSAAGRTREKCVNC